MTLFDVIAGLLLLVSAVVGFTRGATRELVTMLAFLAGAGVAIATLGISGPVFRNFIDPDWAALTAAVLVVFTIVYIIVRMLGARLTARVHDAEAFNMLDRAIGVGFGLIRALVLLGAFGLLFNAATPPDRKPAWVEGAALYPLTQTAANLLVSIAPKGSAMTGAIKPAIEKAVREGNGSTPEGEAYDDREREAVDELVEKSR